MFAGTSRRVSLRFLAQSISTLRTITRRNAANAGEYSGRYTRLVSRTAAQKRRSFKPRPASRFGAPGVGATRTSGTPRTGPPGGAFRNRRQGWISDDSRSIARLRQYCAGPAGFRRSGAPQQSVSEFRDREFNGGHAHLRRSAASQLGDFHDRSRFRTLRQSHSYSPFRIADRGWAGSLNLRLFVAKTVPL